MAVTHVYGEECDARTGVSMRSSRWTRGGTWVVLGACFAETGNEGHCIDKDAAKIGSQPGEVPIYERVSRRIVSRKLHRKSDWLHDALQTRSAAPSVVLIASAQTTGEDGSADLKYVLGGGERSRPVARRLYRRR